MIHHRGDTVTVHHGDCIEVLATLPDNSIDAVVTDPPYGLEFMGKEWDKFDRKGPASFENLGQTLGGYGPGTTRGRSPLADKPRWSTMGPSAMTAFQAWCQLWAAECLRVLRPGGHMLAFGGTRTWHRLATAIEDAGFEIRDSIAWLYGSGFAKGGLLGNRAGIEWCSCDRKAVLYNHANDSHVSGVRDDVHPSTIARGEGEDRLLLADVQREGARSGVGEAFTQGTRGVVTGDGGAVSGEHSRIGQSVLAGRELPGRQGLSPGTDAGSSERTAERLRAGTRSGDGIHDRARGDASRGSAPRQQGPGGQSTGELEAVPEPHGALDDRALRDGPVCARCGGLTPAFRGFSTALKPAHEPIVVARKPLVGNVARNVLEHGTGALNVDACRIGTTDTLGRVNNDRDPATAAAFLISGGKGGVFDASDKRGGRWPANVALDEHQAAVLDQMAPSTGAAAPASGPTLTGRSGRGSMAGHFNGTSKPAEFHADSGGASRFFYVAKAPRSERPTVDGVSHATVKPLTLMRWLVRLVTPPGGTVLEPFAGSGTTVEAAVLEGFRCIAVEREAEYLPLIMARLARIPEPADPELTLFDGEAS
jgi:DNA modification methylase